MDNSAIATLEDIQKAIEESLEEIENKINSYRNEDKKGKNLIKKEVQKKLENIKKKGQNMLNEINDLRDEENKEKWEKIFSNLKKRIKEYKEKINNIDTLQISNEEKKDEYLDPDAKVSVNELNVEQAMKRGDNILEDDGKRITNMNKIVNKDVDTMKGVNIALNDQKIKLEGVDNDLKEIDFSIDRARKKITNMFKIYASDKCVICLIVVILIIIVTIILVSAFGGDNKNNFNVPHDIFDTNKKNTNSTTNSEQSIISCFNLMRVIILYILFFL
jgi:SNARE protein